MRGEGLAIGNRAARAFRRASTFVDAALSAAGLAIEVAPHGRSAGGGAGDWKSRRAGVPLGEGLAIDIAPHGRSAGGGAGD